MILTQLFVKNKILSFILLASFLLSFSYSLYYKIQPKVDALAYDNIAWNIASGNGYRESVSVPVDLDNAIARVGPLYEYFLALIYTLFGHSYTFVWFFQALLHAISAFLLYKVCLTVFRTYEKREKLALWAAGIFGFYPDLIEISSMLLTETLYLFLLCLMLYLFFEVIGRDYNENKSVIVLGFVSGLAALARPPLLFCLPILFFYFYNNRLFKQLVWFSLALVVIFIPWTVRNYNVYGEIMPFGVAGQLNFWIGNHPGSRGEQEAGQEIENFSKTHPVKELGDESIRQFKNFIISYPGEFVEITLLRINKYFSIIRPMGFWFYTSGWRQMLFVGSSVLGSIFLFIFGFAGAVKMFRERNRRFNYFLSFLVITPLILFITVVETRYRFQIYPLLAICAAYFVSIFDLRERDIRKIFLISIFVVFLNGGIDLLMNVDRFLDRIGGWI